MDRWVAEETSDKYRLLGQLMLMSCGIFAGMAFFLRMDMLYTMFIVLSLYTFYKMLHGKGNTRRNSVLFPIFIFLGIFTKGPLGLLITLVSTISFLLVTGRGYLIKRYWGWKTWSILGALTTAWFATVYMEAGSGYLYNLAFHQTLGRAINSFHHAKAIYFYLECIWYVMAPWSLFALFIITVSAKRHFLNTELRLFFFIIVCTSGIVLSLVSSKLSVYLLPIIPFIIYLTVTLMPQFKWNKWIALTLAIPLSIFSLCLVLPLITTIIKDAKLEYLYPTASILIATGITALLFLYHWHNIAKSITITACGLLCAVFAMGCTMPNLNNDFGYGKLCTNIKTHTIKISAKEYYTWKLYRAENMDVYLHDSIHVIKDDNPTKYICDKHGALLIMKEEDENSIPPSIRNNKLCNEGQYIVLKIP